MPCPSLCSRFNRPRPVAWFFFIGGFGLMLALGTWQLDRLAWKRALLAEIAAAGEANPITALPEGEEDIRALEFHHARLTGKYIPDTEFHVTPRYYKGTIGYQIFVPFVMEDGRILLVNRGWVPARLKKPAARPDSLAPEGEQTIEGILRLRADRTYFTPVSQPEKNIWFGRDVAAMAESGKLENVVPISLDIVGEQEDSVLPIPSDGTIQIRNDHLQYAITWYLIGLGILVIFVTYHHKGKGEA